MRNNKFIGALFCLIAAILVGARYIAAAIFMSGTASWSAELFRDALTYVGPALLIAAVVAVVIGVCFLIAGILEDKKSK